MSNKNLLYTAKVEFNDTFLEMYLLITIFYFYFSKCYCSYSVPVTHSITQSFTCLIITRNAGHSLPIICFQICGAQSASRHKHMHWWQYYLQQRIPRRPTILKQLHVIMVRVKPMLCEYNKKGLLPQGALPLKIHNKDNLNMKKASLTVPYVGQHCTDSRVWFTKKKQSLSLPSAYLPRLAL